ncbi:hypothetical protein HDE_14069 [Halotydeus destructor]|nr:hypothetical protein HDE_14069 [Halotydeus destructor]
MRYSLASVSRAFLLLCIAGLSFQLFYIVQHYMAYKTVSQISANTPDFNSAVDFTICYGYPHVLNYSQVNTETGLNLSSVSDYQYILDLFSVSQILRFSPSHEQLFDKFDFRYPGDYEFTTIPLTHWKDKVHVTKFLTQSYVCFTFTVNLGNSPWKSYFHGQVAKLLTSSGAIYEMDLNVTARAMKIIVHPRESRPTNVIMFSPLLVVDDLPVGELFDVSYRVLQVELLEPPYDTMCRNYSPQYEEKSDCTRSCSKPETLHHLDKIPYEILEYDSTLEKKLIASSDLRNATIRDILRRIRRHCRSKCSQPDCFEYSTLTQVSRSPIKNGRKVYINIPSQPCTIIRFYEATKMMDILIYIMSSAGAWLGMSVLSFDPTKWLPKKSIGETRVPIETWPSSLHKKDGWIVRQNKLK